MKNYRTLTDPFEIIDCLRGSLSGIFINDVQRAQNNGCIFSIQDYLTALEYDLDGQKGQPEL